MLARLRKPTEENEGGFTLIELLVVMIIIGILAAIAIPSFLNQRKKGYDSQAKSDARNIATLEETYLTDNTGYIAGDPVTTLTFKKSSTTGALAVKTYSDAVHGTPATTGSAQSAAYCVSAVSQSGTTFYYDSVAGGFTTTAC